MDIAVIGTYAQLACILEASCPKPGNVNRYHDFEDTRYEDFLVSGVGIGRHVDNATLKGFMAGSGEISIESIGIGTLIKDAVLETKRMHSGGNTNLGISMLLIPLAASCGFSIALDKFNTRTIRHNLDRIIRATTYQDTLELYDAIRTLKPSWLGKVKYLDVEDKRSLDIIRDRNLNLFDVMKASKNDSIAKELTTKMEISFEVGYPIIEDIHSKTRDINMAILNCFLTILSKFPDSLIIRKNGLGVAREISKEAGAILKGGIDEKELEDFDKKLRNKRNRLNPGTTADLTTSSLMIALLNKIKI
ncbi:MAG: triphosphoribosyl-dephospho-CoA synthase [Candidatus Hydrothermarchaeales archaeon]